MRPGIGGSGQGLAQGRKQHLSRADRHRPTDKENRLPARKTGEGLHQLPKVAASDLRLLPSLVGEGLNLDPNLRVFIAARNAERQGMPPLAASSIDVGSLPTTIRLDSSNAVGAFNLASAETIYISALVSFSGSANPQTGDYRVVSENITPNGQHAALTLVIDQRIP